MYTPDIESTSNRIDKETRSLVIRGYREAISLQREVHNLKKEINRITNEYRYSTLNFSKEINKLETLEDELYSRLN